VNEAAVTALSEVAIDEKGALAALAR